MSLFDSLSKQNMSSAMSRSFSRLRRLYWILPRGSEFNVHINRAIARAFPGGGLKMNGNLMLLNATILSFYLATFSLFQNLPQVINFNLPQVVNFNLPSIFFFFSNWRKLNCLGRYRLRLSPIFKIWQKIVCNFTIKL